MRFIAATIGRNIGKEPMYSEKWRNFRSDLWTSISDALLEEPEFYQEFFGAGMWDGVAEENFRQELYFQDNGREIYNSDVLCENLRALAIQYGQDAIAFLEGESTLL